MHSLGILLAPLPLLSSWSQAEVQFLLRVHRFFFFLMQQFQERIKADSPWGKNSLGFPSQYPRDSITGPIIYCWQTATPMHSALQQPPSLYLMILRVKNLGRARLGDSWVHRALTVKSLGSIRLGWSCLVPWWGWMEGWTWLRLPTSVSTHVLSSLADLVVRLLHGRAGSRRPRWKPPLFLKA